LLGNGSDHPQISAILKDFQDVLVSELPPGMPKVRKAQLMAPILNTPLS
jgi:hypothetical protein